MLEVFTRRLVVQDLRAVFYLGIPLVFNNISSIGVNVADTLMASAMGPKQLAAIALGSGVWISLFLLGLGILMSIGPTVAQHYGAKKYQSIERDTKQGFWLAVGIGFVLIIVMRSFYPVYGWLGIDPEVSILAQGYLDGLSWGVFGALGYHTLKQMSEGIGRTVPIMIVMLCALPINILLNYILMFGKVLPNPMGAPGCGLGSGISFWLMFFMLYFYIKYSKRYDSLFSSFSLVSPDQVALKRLMRLGLPIGFSFFLQSSLFTSVALLMGLLGTQAIAAHQIVLNFSGLVFMLPLGLGMALTICVGQAVGRNDLTSATRIGITGISICTLISCLSASLTWFFAGDIAKLYTSDERIASLAIDLFRIAVFLQVGDAVQTAAAFCLRGLKDTRVPMILNGLNYWGVGFVTAYLAGIVFHKGPDGIWSGIAISLCLAGVLLVTRFIFLTRSLRKAHARIS